MDLNEGLSGFFGSINFGAILDKIYFFGALVILFLLIGGIGFALWYIRSRKNKDTDYKEIWWWEEAMKGPTPTRIDKAEEIIIPGTSLRVFYVKKKDLWLPRFTKGITKDLFFVGMTPNRQMVNFTLGSFSTNMKDANLQTDNTEMLWAAENTREFIKRNYKDKSTKWWKEYQGVITTAIYILVMTFSFILIIYFLKDLIQDVGALISTADNLLKNSCQNALSSGVVQG